MSATAIRPLHAIADEYVGIIERLEESGGEWSPEIQADLDAINDTFAQKVERVCLYLKNIEADATAAKTESLRLSNLAAQRDRAVDGLKAYLKFCLERVGEKKVSTPLVTVRIQANPPSVSSTLLDSEIPEAFRRVTVALDKTKVIEAWKAEQPLPDGVTVTRNSHIRIL